MLSNKLALHARRVTVMPKDVRLLRDLWKYISPNHAIARMSDEMVEGIVRANRVDEHLKKKARMAAWERRERLRRLGQPIPAGLTHYLRGCALENGVVTRPSGCKYKMLARKK
jgi:uncharacterized protein YeeX (DUF496 family)